MNTPASVAYGWAALIVAGAAGYYVAKKEINAQRRAQTVVGIRPAEELTWQQRVMRDEEMMRQKQVQQQQQQNPGSSSNNSASAS